MAFLFILLFAAWLVLSGFFSAFFIISGVTSCAVAVFISYRLGALPYGACRLFFRPRFFTYNIWLLKEIIKSSWDVSVRMWQLQPDISPRLAWVPTVQKDEVGLTMFANSITLTPGTVTVMVEPDRMLVHALCSEGISGLQEGDMDRRVAKMVEA